MSLQTNIFIKYPNRYLFETGSHIGTGIIAALKAGFEHVWSIELSDMYYKYCLRQFSGNSRVKLFKGDSALELGNIIMKINDQITFWLDGHYSSDNTARGIVDFPLLHELEHIKNHTIKNHTILVDDLRCFHKDDPEIGFDLQDIKNKILEINPNYEFNLEEGFVPDDILVAKVKI